MRTGVVSAVVAYGLWGFLPLYWKQLHGVPAPEILAHRMLWSFMASLVLVGLLKGRPARYPARMWLVYTASGAVICVNWLLYIWAVTHEHVLASSLGYFLNPLVTVLLGAWLFHERLHAGQRVAVLLAACGALYLAARASGPDLPVALALAFTFATYGVLRKQAPLSSLEGMFLETLAVAPWGLAYLVYLGPQGHFVGGDWECRAWLAGSGVVTMLPLLYFSAAAQRLPLATLGMLQYISPTLQFALAVRVYQEPFSQAQLVGFSLIWAGLAVYTRSMPARGAPRAGPETQRSDGP